MLHDPRHDKTPTLAGFALFVASKPEDEYYEWPNCRVCAVGQYLASIGRDVPLANWDGDIATMNQLAHADANRFSDEATKLWTFGKLADRILAHQMAQTACA